ncbi:MAG: hypothetical protein M3416_04800 [Acidobacteriota bacterium]|nr:hypothetical protein [Acidobacteriota bacterium]
MDVSLGGINLRDKAKQKGLDFPVTLADETGIAEEFAKEMVNGFSFFEFGPSVFGNLHAPHKV